MTEVLSMVLAPAVSRRRDDWLRELADGLDEIERKVDAFRIEDLANNDAFISATIEQLDLPSAHTKVRSGPLFEMLY